MRIVANTCFAAVAAMALLSAPLACGPAAAQSAGQSAAASTPADNSVEARVDAFIKKLHAQLHITAAEKAEWKEFTAVMRQNARHMERAFNKRMRELDTMNAVDSLKSYERLAEAHAQRLKRLVPAFEKLYAALPLKQKKLADKVFREDIQKHAPPQEGGSSQPSR